MIKNFQENKNPPKPTYRIDSRNISQTTASCPECGWWRPCCTPRQTSWAESRTLWCRRSWTSPVKPCAEKRFFYTNAHNVKRSLLSHRASSKPDRRPWWPCWTTSPLQPRGRRSPAGTESLNFYTINKKHAQATLAIWKALPPIPQPMSSTTSSGCKSNSCRNCWKATLLHVKLLKNVLQHRNSFPDVPIHRILGRSARTDEARAEDPLVGADAELGVLVLVEKGAHRLARRSEIGLLQHPAVHVPVVLSLPAKVAAKLAPKWTLHSRKWRRWGTAPRAAWSPGSCRPGRPGAPRTGLWTGWDSARHRLQTTESEGLHIRTFTYVHTRPFANL